MGTFWGLYASTYFLPDPAPEPFGIVARNAPMVPVPGLFIASCFPRRLKGHCPRQSYSPPSEPRIIRVLNKAGGVGGRLYACRFYTPVRQGEVK